MYGDADASSVPIGSLDGMSIEEREFSFHHKRLSQRIAVVAAGPVANFVFAIVLLAGLFATVGQPFTPPDVGQVQPGSAAERGGIKPGDTIAMIDGHAIERFEDVQQAVALNNGSPMAVVVHRDGRDISLDVTPQMTERTDRFGNVHRVGLLGIGRSGVEYVRHDPARASWRAVEEPWNLASGTLKAIWQMVVGARTPAELGGPLPTAHMSDDGAQ